MSHILFLNGPTSSGKTSVAKELQLIGNKIYVYVSADQFLFTGLPESIKEVHPDQTELITTLDVIKESMYEYINALCSKGVNVILDSVVFDTDLVDIAEKLSKESTYLVKVICKTEELMKRERDRGDRRIGMAEFQEQFFRNPIFDFILDTTDKSPKESASELHSYINTKQIPSAIEQISLKNISM
jgi:chloramphenicol 3-O phosphotransferase